MAGTISRTKAVGGTMFERSKILPPALPGSGLNYFKPSWNGPGRRDFVPCQASRLAAKPKRHQPRSASTRTLNQPMHAMLWFDPFFDLESAAVEQVAFLFQQRDKLGLIRQWPHDGTYIVLIQLPLLPQV